MFNRHRSRWMLLLSFFLAHLSFASALTDLKDVSGLRALYGALGAPPQLTGWHLEGGDPCGSTPWRGVACSGPSVVSVKINGLGIGGFLGLELSSFESLKELDVSENSIGGEIPSQLPPNATYINFGSNHFIHSIPYSLSTLKKLNYLNASHNFLSEPIGNVLTDMGSLEKLDLSFNHFVGDLPNSFSLLKNLHELYLQGNQFTGSVNFLANLPLSVLNLENNHFSGSVPKQFQFIPFLRINGNLFNFVYPYPPPLLNATFRSPHPSPVRNVTPTQNVHVAPSFFNSSSERVDNQNSKGKSARDIAASIIGVLLLIVAGPLLVMVLLLIYCSGDLAPSESTDNLPHIHPATLPIPSPANPHHPIGRSPPISSLRPSSVCNRKSNYRRQSISRKSTSLQTTIYQASDILTATKNYSNENILGEGSIGCIYRAEFPDGQMAAVKKINMRDLADYEEQEFLDVIMKISHLNHQKVAAILGCCVDMGEHAIVYEYADNGSLADFMFSENNTREVLSWNTRMRIALDVALTLEYMHLCSPSIAHGNIKAANILLDDDLTPRITDFGLNALRRFVRARPESSELPITSCTAPEYGIPGADEAKIDVFSFGVLMLELLTGMRGFDSSREGGTQSLVKWVSSKLHDLGWLSETVDPKIRGTVPLRALSQFADIVLRCTQPRPELRPQMTHIVEDMTRLTGLVLDQISRTVSAKQGSTSTEFHSCKSPKDYGTIF